jgi:hypothetical protein
MKAVVLSCALFAALFGCGHKKPKEAKATTAPTTASENKCEVKGFNYSIPEPGPITDGGAK